MIQIDDCTQIELTDVDEDIEQELRLENRSGRVRHSYVRGDGCIQKLNKFINDAKHEPDRTAF